jgi:predicted RNA-binding Zn-ribbon protein involved in translation (DUF1610 family)
MSQIFVGKDEEKKKRAQCHKCKYEWETASKMFIASCPKCGNKVRIGRLVK